MKLMTCPLNGPRNMSEFVYGGEIKDMPNHQTCTDKEWADYVFYSENTIKVIQEWWFHAPSGYWFIAERHTASDDILRTFDPSERYQSRVEFTLPEPTKEDVA